MAEKILEKEICQACGADVRPNTQFCYNCGSAVAAPDAASKITGGKGGTGTLVAQAPIIGDNSSKNTTDLTKTQPSVVEKPAVVKTETPPVKMKSAADLRQNPKLTAKKTIRVAWEEPDRHPGLGFIIATIILVLFAVGIVFAMEYIK